MSNDELVQIACFLTRGQREQLREITARTHVPMSVFVRQAVEAQLVKQAKRPRGTK